MRRYQRFVSPALSGDVSKGGDRKRLFLGLKIAILLVRVIGERKGAFAMVMEKKTEVKSARTMRRLKNFDYRKPFYYMVTLKKTKGLPPFCEITKEKIPPKDIQGRVRYLIINEITRAFEEEIKSFHFTWPGIWPIECFVIMPDHLHLLIRLKDKDEQLPLGTYIYHLMRRLHTVYWERMIEAGIHQRYVSTMPSVGTSSHSRKVIYPPLFERDWHDWIVKKRTQLSVFTQYIRENPRRSWLRWQNRAYFGVVRKVSFLGYEWFAYGNIEILNLPILKAVKGHRSTRPDSHEWKALVDDCLRIGPIGAGVGTFMSPLEKACGNAIAVAGGKWVILSPEGFSARWHPPRRYEKYCAEGRMLFLSRYPLLNRMPTRAELYQRCHEMGDIAVKGLSPDNA